MKYDIAKNEDGPLRRTLKSGGTQEATQEPSSNNSPPQDATAERHPGLDERLRSIETHLAVRYGTLFLITLGSFFTQIYTVPSPPQLLLDRIKFLEDHIMLLEKEYPPWAALHFNQPRRGVNTLLSIHFI